MHTLDLSGLVTCAPRDARVIIADWLADLIRERAATGDPEYVRLIPRLVKVEEQP